jgi:hypothetical protein
MRSFLIALMCLATVSTVGVAQNTAKPTIEVELNRQKPLHLRVTLRSGAATTATFYQSELPWGNRYSMVFAAVRPNGEPVDLIFPVDDPGPTKVSVKAREALTGDIDLRYVVRDVNAMKKSEVLLFWAYKAPDELHIPRWSGGLVLIPQQK